MEMTLTVHVRRRRPRPVDVVVRWSGAHTAADLAVVLGAHLGEPVPFLTSGGRLVDAGTSVGMPPLVDGASVAVGSGSPSLTEAGPPGSVLDLAVVGGPDCGRSRPLVPPGLQVGRSVADGLALGDEALSRVHATVRVGSSGIVVEDVGSTNGVVVNGRATHGPTAVDASSTIVLGSSTLRVRRAGVPGVPVHARGDGTLQVQPPGVVVRPLGPVDVECPQPPAAPNRSRIPWVGALVPVPIAVALALVLGPQLLLFALVGPVALLANAVADRWGAGRTHRRATAEHAVARRVAQERLDRALQVEVARLDADHPDPHAVLTAAELRLPSLWRGDGLGVRLGLGDVPTRVAWLDGSTRSHPLAAHAPVVLDLAEVGCLGVVGPRAVTDRLLANLVGQLCTRHPPDRLRVGVAAAPPSWTWTSRMPHAAPEWAGEPPPPAGTGPEPVRLLVVPSAEGEGVAPLVAGARLANALVIAASGSAAALPRDCTAVVERTQDGRHTLTRGEDKTVLTLDLVGPWWADRVSRALAPLRSSGGHHPSKPTVSVTLCELLEERRLTPEFVRARWAEATQGGKAASEPVAAVGVGDRGVHRIDLRRDGPHILVGGTTGSGKSEFLRTLVTSLAVGSPPTDLAFVLVDFKGGAAFGPCADLPHVVGLVTDLDDHLVDRALTSLGAELRRRERIFAAAAAPDLDGYLRCRGPGDEAVPRLVVVVDELRALVDEVPAFVSGMVRLAALGRSLGVHLVLATQRPAGVVTPEIQANVNLRIAFRVRDRADSLDVLDDAAAATLPPGSPGRALARGGDGVLVAFQAAVVAPTPEAEGRYLSVTSAQRPLADAEHGSQHALSDRQGQAKDDDRRLGEISEVVAAIAQAHRTAGRRSPAPPWVAPLPLYVEPLHRPDGATREAVVGLVDEPGDALQVRLVWSPTGGTWLLVGRPRSGRTTAARAVAVAAAAAHDPDRLHIHVLDTSGSLADLAALPHVGTLVRVDDWRAVASLVVYLREEVDRRRSAPDPEPHLEKASRRAHILVVIDGWERLVESQPEAWAGGTDEDLVRLLRDGDGVGLGGVVTGARSLLQPKWSGLGASAFLFGTVDPLDAALAGLRSSDVPTSPPPGRAVRVGDRRSVQFAAVSPGVSAVVSAGVAAGPWRPTRGEGPFVLRPLPVVVRRRDALSEPGHHRDGDVRSHPAPMDELRLAVGVAGTSASTWEWAPDRMGRRLLVAGPARSGRTNVLRVIEQDVLAVGRPVAVVSGRRRAGSELWAGASALGPHEVDALVDLRRAHPDLVLLVDDADLLDDSPVVPAVREISGLVDRDGGLVVVTTSASAVLGRLRGLDVDCARHRTGLLLTPRPGDGDVFGLRRLDGIPSHPGRGLVCIAGEATELQVFLADPEEPGGEAASGRGVRVGDDVIVVSHGHGGQDGGQGHGHHRPPHEGPASLDQADTDGQQQQVPEDRRRAGPGGSPEPSATEEREGGPAEQDEQGRHEHPGGVAPLAERELVDVERGEPHERERLDSGEQGGNAAGAA